MKKYYLFSLIGLLLLLLCACGPKQGNTQQVVLSCGQERYDLDSDSVTLVLTNNSAGPVSYSKAAWVELLHSTQADGSRAYSYKLDWKEGVLATLTGTASLAAGQTDTLTVYLTDLAQAPKAGSYRIGVDVGDEPLYAEFVLE